MIFIVSNSFQYTRHKACADNLKKVEHAGKINLKKSLKKVKKSSSRIDKETDLKISGTGVSINCCSRLIIFPVKHGEIFIVWA